MNFLYHLLGAPLGYVIWLIYEVVRNYGVAIILFTVILKLTLYPLAVKQQKATAKMGAFQPMINEINKKYAKNPKKKNEELQKLYTEEGYSPTAGCLPMILQFVILFGIIDVVYRPLTHILHMGADVISQACSIAGLNPDILTSQIGVVQQLQQDPSKFASLGDATVQAIQGLDMHFLGLNLGALPEWTSITIIIPILAGAFSFLQIFLSMKMNPMGQDTPGMGMSSKIMMIVMPLFSVWITFTVPIGVGLYWIVSYVFMVGQTLVLNKVYNPKKLREEAIAELEERRKSRKKKVVVKEVVKKGEDGQEIVSEEVVSQKELDRIRLAEARKRDAEKYGEDFVEVTDDDLK